MFVPLHDKNPLQSIRFQYMTLLLILLNVGIYIVFQSGVVLPYDEATMVSFALVPNELFAEGLFGPSDPYQHHDVIPLPERWTLISYMFLHGSLVHLIGNMLFLWVFGDNVEDAMGHFRFLIFYLICGVASGYIHSLLAPQSQSPLIGASGAVSGVVGAYLLLHPKVRIWILVMGGIPLPVNAGIALVAWFGFQLYQAFFVHGGNVAWWAHIGGFLVGVVLILLFKRRDVPLFDRGID